MLQRPIPYFLAAMVFMFGVGMIATAQHKTSWKTECFGTLDAMVNKLNQLPGDAAGRSHIAIVPSSRNVGGWLGQPYCLVHP